MASTSLAAVRVSWHLCPADADVAPHYSCRTKCLTCADLLASQRVGGSEEGQGKGREGGSVTAAAVSAAQWSPNNHSFLFSFPLIFVGMYNTLNCLQIKVKTHPPPPEPKTVLGVCVFQDRCAGLQCKGWASQAQGTPSPGREAGRASVETLPVLVLDVLHLVKAARMGLGVK